MKDPSVERKLESAPFPEEQKAGLLTGMTVLIATDGSEEIHRASRLAVAWIRPEAIERFIVLTVTWPPHDAPLWNEATMRHVIVDDLHQAVAIVAIEATEQIAQEYDLSPYRSTCSSKLVTWPSRFLRPRAIATLI